MADVGEIKVELKAHVVDNASPVLRRLQLGFWLYSHPTLVAASAALLIFALAFTTGLLLGEHL